MATQHTDDLRGQPITIIGAGAIGGTVGAYLSAAGYDVTLVDIVPEHIAAINEHGIRITGVRGDHTFHPKAMLRSDLRGPLGTTILAVKGHYTKDAACDVAPLLAPDGYILSLQNGMNEPIIAHYVGEERTVGAFVHFGADYLAPGHIQLGTEQTIFIGELSGRVTPRAEALRDLLAHVMPAEVTTNLWGFLWGKLVYGALAFAVSVVDATVPEVLANETGRRVALAACFEAYAVAKSQTDTLERIGEFDPNAFAPGSDAATRGNAAIQALSDGMAGSVKQHMGIWRDLAVRKRKTEIDMQVSVLVATGERAGIPTPINAAVRDITHAIEAGGRGMGWDNLDEIARRGGL